LYILIDRLIYAKSDDNQTDGPKAVPNRTMNGFDGYYVRLEKTDERNIIGRRGI